MRSTKLLSHGGGLRKGRSVARALRTRSEAQASISQVSRDSVTVAGEALVYSGTSSPEISSFSGRSPPGATTPWMTHPVPAYLYVLAGTLTVEFDDGSLHEFTAGQAFLQARTKWHRGRNDGTAPAQFLAVFCGAKGVPEVVRPPAAASAGCSTG